MKIKSILILLLSLQISLICHAEDAATATPIPQELLTGFSAVPQPTTTPFQAILTDPTGNFSLGFLRQNQNQLKLAVIHVASSEPFWVANPTRLASWAHTTRLSFNGSLVLSDSKTGVSWSTATNGHRAVLLNNSNLQVQNRATQTPIWESFHFPTNTLVQDQNLTADKSLVSSNGLYSFRLGDDFMGLYTNLNGGKRLLYWKHTAMEAKDEVKEGEGPIYARVNSEGGYLGMYQTSSKPVDVQKFSTFQQDSTTSSFLLVRLETDGNLKGYYWNGSNWMLNYEAIGETCELPNPCGSYGLCTPGGAGCSCLDNQTRFESGGCEGGGGGDLCGGRGFGGGESYRVLRRSGVEPPHKELVAHVTTASLAGCEGLCERNCSCWGVFYSNATGFCYVLDYPVGTVLGTGDGSKVGYFKVREGGEGRNRVGARVGIVVGVLVLIGVVIFGVGLCVKRLQRRRGVSGGMLKEENGHGASPGPYRNLKSASFRSIEMSVPISR
ncbi:PAN domain-containing protein At5g03700 [Lotus japonicus]|uniref:PAN domain-containing protein At5g03700 n=1 Tax=Lotus japonicus TaxID=34305 RepID=UPI00258BBEC4|nr:PAN domain-containing protein At5g03700 [Lotus japonicus]